MAIRGAGASGDGPGGLKTGVLRQFKVGFAAVGRDACHHHFSSDFRGISKCWKVKTGQNGSKRVNMSLSEHVKMGQLIGRGVSELIGE